MAAEVAEVAVEVTVAEDGAEEEAAAADEVDSVANVTVPNLLIGTDWTAPDDVKLRRQKQWTNCLTIQSRPSSALWKTANNVELVSERIIPIFLSCSTLYFIFSHHFIIWPLLTHILVEEARSVEDIPLAKLSADKQVISGRKIEILQNQFKIEITDPTRMIGIYEVAFQPLSTGKFDKPLKREDNRNLIQNLSKELGTNGLKYDGENLLISNQLLHKINHSKLRGARENEDVIVSILLLAVLSFNWC